MKPSSPIYWGFFFCFECLLGLLPLGSVIKAPITDLNIPEARVFLSSFAVSTLPVFSNSSWGIDFFYEEDTIFFVKIYIITADAFQSSTDGNDFYFASFSKDVKELLYATYFGSNGTVSNNAGEHVDGGTSRIDKNGMLYQAACAGCYGVDEFPTSVGAWSNENGTSQECNWGVVKFNLNPDVEVQPNPIFNVGIENTSTEQLIKVYPNPNDGQFMIEPLENNSQSTIKIFNSIGQIVFEKNEINAPTLINLKEQGSGVYLISVETNDGIVVEKVVLRF